MSNRTTRRDWLKAAGMGIGMTLGAGLGGGCGNLMSAPSRASGTGARKNRSGSIRIAHFTDTHVQPELDAPRGMAACLHHIQSQRHTVDLIFNTGDCVMDVLHSDRARTEQQWAQWRKVLKDECSLPIEHCLGNHDIWGWSMDASGTTGGEAGWGKKWAMDELGLAKPYHSFERGAWKLIMLDSVQPAAEGVWETRIDEEQFAWLERELAATKKPVMIGSHIPIMSPSVFLDDGRIGGTPEAPALSPRRCHIDVKRIGALFRQHPHVKLCVSGHLHQIDRADFLGVTYVTNPAVCGNWWQGLHRGVFGEMYTLIDLHADGTFDIEYVDYGWTPATTQPAASHTT